MMTFLECDAMKRGILRGGGGGPYCPHLHSPLFYPEVVTIEVVYIGVNGSVILRDLQETGSEVVYWMV
jgi:hypothetical protein